MSRPSSWRMVSRLRVSFLVFLFIAASWRGKAPPLVERVRARGKGGAETVCTAEKTVFAGSS
jgi:hypothetical protein